MKKAVSRMLSAVLALTLCFTFILSGLAEEAAPNPSDVLLLVNGTAVTRGTFEDYRANLLSYFSQQGYDMTIEDNIAVVNQLALDTVIEDTILDQKAAELNIGQLTDEERAEIEAENTRQWEEIIDMYLYYGGITAESTEEEITAARLGILAQLEAMGYTESILLESALENAKYEKIYAYIVQDATVTDEEIQAAFDAHVADDQAIYENDIAYYEFMTQYYGYTSYYTPAGYRGVTHILLEADEALLSNWQALAAQLEEQQDEDVTDPQEEGAEAGDDETAVEPVTQEQVDAAYAAIIASVQPTIDEINEKLASGVPFAELIEAYGTDPGMTVEPNRSNGYPVHMDSIIWDPAFVAGAFSVDEVGAVAQPVVGSYGVHIIQYTRDIPAGAVELTEELRAAIADEVLSEKESAIYRETMDAWLAESDITYSAEAQAMLLEPDAE